MVRRKTIFLTSNEAIFALIIRSWHKLTKTFLYSTTAQKIFHLPSPSSLPDPKTFIPCVSNQFISWFWCKGDKQKTKLFRASNYPHFQEKCSWLGFKFSHKTLFLCHSLEIRIKRLPSKLFTSEKPPSKGETTVSHEAVQESIMAVDETINNLIKELKQERKSHHKVRD